MKLANRVSGRVTVPRHKVRCPVRSRVASPALEPAVDLHPDIESILYSEQTLRSRVQQMGRDLAQTYTGKDLMVIGVLKGAFVFTADLVRHMDPQPDHLLVEFVKVSSYGSGTTSKGAVLNEDFDLNKVKGKHVLVVEDIIDTGNTLKRVTEYLRDGGAASVKVCALLDKKERRQADITPDFTGFVCPNEFVVGYGLDFDEKYRCLPYIGVLQERCYS